MSIIESKPIVIRFETNYDVGEDDEEKDGHINAKWYDHEKDLALVSLAFPHLLLKLRGKGEEDWRAC